MRQSVRGEGREEGGGGRVKGWEGEGGCMVIGGCGYICVHSI